MKTAKTLFAIVLLSAMGSAWACPGMVHKSDDKKPAAEQAVNPPATAPVKK